MRHKKLEQMPIIELEALSTRQLLARLNRLQQCEDSLALSDRDDTKEQPDNGIEFKETEQWKEAYYQVKQVLAKREHIEKDTALVKQRQEKRKLCRTTEKKVERSKFR
jgi:hypothetical protein